MNQGFKDRESAAAWQDGHRKMNPSRLYAIDVTDFSRSVRACTVQPFSLLHTADAGLFIHRRKSFCVNGRISRLKFCASDAVVIACSIVPLQISSCASVRKVAVIRISAFEQFLPLLTWVRRLTEMGTCDSLE